MEGEPACLTQKACSQAMTEADSSLGRAPGKELVPEEQGHGRVGWPHAPPRTHPEDSVALETQYSSRATCLRLCGASPHQSVMEPAAGRWAS